MDEIWKDGIKSLFVTSFPIDDSTYRAIERNRTRAFNVGDVVRCITDETQHEARVVSVDTNTDGEYVYGTHVIAMKAEHKEPVVYVKEIEYNANGHIRSELHYVTSHSNLTRSIRTCT